MAHNNFSASTQIFRILLRLRLKTSYHTSLMMTLPLRLNKYIVIAVCLTFSTISKLNKTLENTCLIMVEMTINCKLWNKMPPWLMAKHGLLWHRLNGSVLLVKVRCCFRIHPKSWYTVFIISILTSCNNMRSGCIIGWPKVLYHGIRISPATCNINDHWGSVQFNVHNAVRPVAQCPRQCNRAGLPTVRSLSPHSHHHISIPTQGHVIIMIIIIC